MIKLTSFLFIMSTFLSACSPDVGSKEWCNELKEKSKGEWTTNEITDYAKHCIF